MMKKYCRICFLIYLIAGLFRCESEREFKNIFDPDNANPADWKPENVVIQQLSVERLLITWEHPNPLVQGYVIDRKISDGNWEINFAIIEDRDQKDCQDTIYTLGSEQSYRVTALAGDSYSDFTKATIVPTIAEPKNFSARQVGVFAVQLQWRDMSDGEEGFSISRKVGAADWTGAYKILAANTTHWVDSSVTLNTDVQYRIQPYLGDFTGEPAETTIETEFPAVQNFSAGSISDSSLMLTWSAHSYFDVSQYRVLRSENGGDYTEIASADTCYFIDSSIVKTTEYRYRIESVAGSNTSDQSVVKTASWVGPVEQLWSQVNTGNGGIRAMEIASDNSFVAAAFRSGSSSGMSTAGAIKLWDSATGSQLMTGYAKLPNGISVADDQSYVAIADDYFLQVWNIISAAKQWEVTNQEYKSVSINPDADKLVAADGNNHIQLYDLSDGTAIWDKDMGSSVHYVKFSPVGDVILFNGSSNGMLDLNGNVLWNSMTAYQYFNSNGTMISTSGYFSIDDEFILGTGNIDVADASSGASHWSINAGEAAGIYYATTGTEIWSVSNESNPQWIGDCERIVTVRAEAELVFRDAETGDFIDSNDLSSTVSSISLLDISPNGEQICIGSGAYVYMYGYASYWKVTTEG